MNNTLNQGKKCMSPCVHCTNKLHYAFCLRQDIFAFIVKTNGTSTPVYTHRGEYNKIEQTNKFY